jgi:hypothetical protein
MIVMHAADSFHPPAGINPLLIVVNDRPWSFFVIPVAAGVAILVAFTFLWHNVTRRGSWPEKKSRTRRTNASPRKVRSVEQPNCAVGGASAPPGASNRDCLGHGFRRQRAACVSGRSALGLTYANADGLF